MKKYQMLPQFLNKNPIQFEACLCPYKFPILYLIFQIFESLEKLLDLLFHYYSKKFIIDYSNLSTVFPVKRSSCTSKVIKL